jgi:tetratricopeptide (TPR) repeat protein
MARFTLLVALLLLWTCSAGHAEDSSAPTAVVFWPAPLSKPLLQIVADATGQPGAAGVGTRPSAPLGGDELSAASRAELLETVAKQLDEIKEERDRNGERSPTLIGELAALASSYQALGEHDSAISALKDAVQIARMSFGLHSLDQADLVTSVVESRRAEGDYGDAAAQRQYLRELAGRNSDDPRVVGILSGLAASEMGDANRLLGVPAPSQILVSSGGDVDGTGGAHVPLPPMTPALDALYTARGDYLAALQATKKTGAASPADVLALGDALVDTVYFEFAHPEVHSPVGLAKWHGMWPARAPGSRYPGLSYVGRRFLQAKVQDSVNFGRSTTDVARAVIELGDWYLLFGEYGRALDTYESARHLLVERGVPGERIDGILSPELAPILPVLPDTIAGNRADHAFRGYIDASLEITRFGDVKRVEIIGASPAASKAIERDLRRYLSACVFRPRFLNGELARSDRYSGRFYFYYRSD